MIKGQFTNMLQNALQLRRNFNVILCVFLIAAAAQRYRPCKQHLHRIPVCAVAVADTDVEFLTARCAGTVAVAVALTGDASLKTLKTMSWCITSKSQVRTEPLS